MLDVLIFDPHFRTEIIPDILFLIPIQEYGYGSPVVP